MKFSEAVARCHVRSAIYRKNDPLKEFTQADLMEMHPGLQDLNKDKVGTMVPKRYWKNHPVPLEEQVPAEDQKHEDWLEYDPRDDDDCSLFMFND